MTRSLLGVYLALGFFVIGGVAAQGQDTGSAGDSSQPTDQVRVPRLIRFGGALKDSAGQPKTGTVGVTFAIYADQEGGAPLWLETQNVQLDEAGRYTALLGASTSDGVPLDLFRTGQSRWLVVEGQDIQETPRVLLVSVPYALKASDAETLGGLPVSAFVLSNPQPATAGSAPGRTATLGSNSRSANPGTAAPATGTAGVKPKPAAVGAKNSTTTNLDDYIPVFDSSGNLLPSAMFQMNGNVGIGTTSPAAALHVNGDTLLVNSSTTAQVWVNGPLSSGRFGQDAFGAFLASDTSGSPLRFLTNNKTLNEWMRIGSTGSVNIGSASAARNGEVVFAPENMDSVRSITGQAGSQYHFRLSRATPDAGGGQHLLITPYQYGMVVEYPTTLEFWVQDFSVHHNQQLTGWASAPNFWVGDEIDSGGLFATARDNGGGANSYVMLAADRFNRTSHGSLNFVVRNPTDAFKFDVGAFGAEQLKGQISGTPTASSLDLYSGTVEATLRAQSASSAGGSGGGGGAVAGGVQLGSTSNDTFSLFTNNGAAQVTLFPSGNFSIGNTSDAASLAVGSTAQFQVSSAGAATIGGGTPITRHLSVIAALSFPAFSHRSCNTLTVTVTGAAEGDSVALGIPNALASIDGLTWFGWVSAPDTVSVRGCNVNDGAVLPQPVASVRVDVWQH